MEYLYALLYICRANLAEDMLPPLVFLKNFHFETLENKITRLTLALPCV
jgi:hypothetical protein